MGMTRTARLRRALGVREGESRQVAVLGSTVFTVTAATILLSAAKNGLFLSVYPSRLVPHVIIAAALVTTLCALGFTALIGRVPRRRLAERSAMGFALSLLLARAAFTLDPGTAFGLYLWLSVVQTLAVMQAWDYTGELMDGRQAKRLVPLIAGGGSVAGVLAGFGLAPAALALGTPNLLFLAAALLLLPIPLLRLLPEPAAERPHGDAGAARRFASDAARGLRALAGEPLLRLVGGAVAMTVLVSTLVDYQFKVAMQQSFGRDAITAVYGVLAGVVGVGSLAVQLLAARLVFRRLGVSGAAVGQAGMIGALAAGVAALGTFWLLAALRVLDDVLRFSIQKPVEQVSFAPFPPRLKSPAYAATSGMVRPLAQATAGLLALLVAPGLGLDVLAWLTAATAAVLVLMLLRHRGLYLAALENALARRTLSLAAESGEPLRLDRTALAVLDRALADADPGVAVFATSLLRDAGVEDARPRLHALLEHAAPEVRAEAAAALGDVEADAGPDAGVAALIDRLMREEVPAVTAALLATLGRAGAETALLERFVEHPEPEVRREALIALGRLEDGARTEERLRRLLGSPSAEDRRVAIAVAAALGRAELLPQVGGAVDDPATRADALAALAGFGAAALATLDGLLARADLDLPARRTLVTTLAAIDTERARARLLQLLDHPELAPAALTCLKRLRRTGRLPTLEPGLLRPVLQREVAEGLRHELIAGALGRAEGERTRRVAEEVAGLREKARYRALALLALSHDPERLAAVEAHLLGHDRGQHASALELLEGTLSATDAAIALPLLERTPEQVTAQARLLLPDAAAVEAEPLEALRREDGWWPRALAIYAMTEAAVPVGAGAAADPYASVPLTDEERAMIPLIEKVMLLKGCALFRALPGAELAGVARLSETVHLRAGETLFEEGDAGDAFYVVVAGRIRIERGSHELALLGPREGLGDMALLDRGPRSATATAAEAATLLRIDRDSFDEMVERNPAVARGIYRVLTERLRNTLAQVAAS